MEYVKEHYLKNYNAPAHRVHTDQDDYNETTEAYNNVVNQQNLIRDYLARREAQAISNHNTQRFTPIQNDFTDFSTTNRMRQVKNAERIMTPRQISRLIEMAKACDMPVTVIKPEENQVSIFREKKL